MVLALMVLAVADGVAAMGSAKLSCQDGADGAVACDGKVFSDPDGLRVELVPPIDRAVQKVVFEYDLDGRSGTWTEQHFPYVMGGDVQRWAPPKVYEMSAQVYYQDGDKEIVTASSAIQSGPASPAQLHCQDGADGAVACDGKVFSDPSGLRVELVPPIDRAVQKVVFEYNLGGRSGTWTEKHFPYVMGGDVQRWAPPKVYEMSAQVYYQDGDKEIVTAASAIQSGPASRAQLHCQDGADGAVACDGKVFSDPSGLRVELVPPIDRAVQKVVFEYNLDGRSGTWTEKRFPYVMGGDVQRWAAPKVYEMSAQVYYQDGDKEIVTAASDVPLAANTDKPLTQTVSDVSSTSTGIDETGPSQTSTTTVKSDALGSAETTTSNNGSTDSTSQQSVGSSTSLITLWWEAIPEQVVGYKIYYDNSPRVSTDSYQLLDTIQESGFDPGNPKLQFDTTILIGMYVGDQVCFAVTAYDNQTESPPSDSVCTTI
jgi:hypothetical protein